jgi:hypothetical protein
MAGFFRASCQFWFPDFFRTLNDPLFSQIRVSLLFPDYFLNYSSLTSCGEVIAAVACPRFFRGLTG